MNLHHQCDLRGMNGLPNNSIKPTRKILTAVPVVLLLAASFLSSWGSAMAESKGVEVKPSRYRNINRPTTADAEYCSMKLPGPVPLPNVPNYTGHAKFLTGLRYPNPRTGERIGMTLGVMEEPASVMDWYRDALKMYSWKVAGTSDPNLISGTKDGNSVCVRVMPDSSRNFRSQIVISYQYHTNSR